MFQWWGSWLQNVWLKGHTSVHWNLTTSKDHPTITILTNPLIDARPAVGIHPRNKNLIPRFQNTNSSHEIRELSHRSFRSSMVFHFRQLRQTSFTAMDICKVSDKVKTGVQETLLNEAIESSLGWYAAALGRVRDGVLQRDIEPSHLTGVRNDHRNNFYAITRLRRCIHLID